MVRGIVHHEVRNSPVAEEELDILIEPLLIFLDGEVIVGTAPDDVCGDLPLGKKGIGGYLLTFDVDGGKERDGARDLVRPFDLFIRNPDTAYFFWV
jgi:hypothetical protein